MEEKCPPGTRIERLHPSTNILDLGTVMDIPVYTDSPDSSGNYSYTIPFDNGTTSALPLLDMASIIPTPPVQEEDSTNTNCLLPPFLQLNSKITYDHAGQFHKGFLGIHNGVYRFVYISHVNKRKEDWGVNLPSLPQTWVDLCTEGILLPGHVAHNFCRGASLSTPSTFNPVASFVSVVNLHRNCPPSLIKALADSHHNREICLQSYYKEKRGTQSLDMYCKIKLGEYPALCEKGAPKPIPTMCVLTIKKDEDLRPL